uniref:Uncharacterized protein n=1 Tax=Rhizophora mucronata TaxID=61149 RepID=A0A2P2LXB9_RHIMU
MLIWWLACFYSNSNYFLHGHVEEPTKMKIKLWYILEGLFVVGFVGDCRWVMQKCFA